MKNVRNLERVQNPRNGIQFITNASTRKELQPLVFFDAGSFTRDDNGFKIDFHPHSGIGIITYFHGTDLHHRDSGLNDGIIHDGGAQWILAGGGVWHEEAYRRKHNDSTRNEWEGAIHQLWIQLPPAFEENEVEYANLAKEEIASVENVKVLTGEYKGTKGKMNVPVNMTYLDVSLKDGETWDFQTPTGQTTGFIFPRGGDIWIGQDEIPNNLMGILEHNEGEISVKAQGDVEFVVVLSEPNNLPMVSNGSQIHTTKEALERSMDRVQKVEHVIRKR